MVATAATFGNTSRVLDTALNTTPDSEKGTAKFVGGIFGGISNGSNHEIEHSCGFQGGM
jgi:hypothetical protein